MPRGSRIRNIKSFLHSAPIDQQTFSVPKKCSLGSQSRMVGPTKTFFLISKMSRQPFDYLISKFETSWRS